MTQPAQYRIELLPPELVRVLQAMTPGQRIAAAYDSNRLVRQRLAAHLAREHPQWDAERIARAVAERVLHGTS